MTEVTDEARDTMRTPGPWDIIGGCDWTVDTDSSNTFVHIGPIDGDPVAIAIVADCWFMYDTLDANARMIAAAPELLAALEMVRNNMRKGVTGADSRKGWDMANAAIAKAGGQS